VLAMRSTALLVIDMLNDFIAEGAPLEVPEARKIVPAVRKKIEESRRKGNFIIYICDAHEEDDPEFERMGWPAHAIAGTKGAQVIDELKPVSGDEVIAKKSYSGFFRTSLDEVLQSKGISDLLITGCVTNICVLYTVADAVQRGYKVKVIKDCVAGITTQDHEWGLKQMRDILGAEIVGR